MKLLLAKRLLVALLLEGVVQAPAGNLATRQRILWWGYGPFTEPESSIQPLTELRLAEVDPAEVMAVSAGERYLQLLLRDGTVAGYGAEQSGQASGLPPNPENPARWVHGTRVRIGGQVPSNVVAVSAGRSHCLALLGDGRVVAWGRSELTRGRSELREAHVSPPVTNTVAISAGWDRSGVVLRCGRVVSWGDTHPAPPTLTNAVALAMGKSVFADNFALTRGGTVVSWTGALRYTVSLEELFGLTNVTAIADGGFHALALRADGTVFGWGSNHLGQSTDVAAPGSAEPSRSDVVLQGEPLREVAAVAAGNDFSVALKRDGTLVAWGGRVATDAAFQEFRKLTNIVAVTAGSRFVVVIQRLTE